MRDIGDAWYPSKIKVGSQIPARIVNLIPTMANEGSLDYNERNMKEIGGRTQGWEKNPGENQVESHFMDFPGNKLFEGYWECLASLKNPSGQLLESYNSRNWPKKQPVKTKYILFLTYSQ
jgi:hypothetical protein